MEKTYKDLFEDEVSELLKETGYNGSIYVYNNVMYKKSCGLYDDGIYSANTGYYTEYRDGKRSSVVSKGFLIDLLSHSEFVISFGKE